MTALAASEGDLRTIRLSGPKVDSFAMNLLGLAQEVTNDTFIAQVFGLDQAALGGDDGAKNLAYKAVNALTRQAAEILSVRTGEEWTASEVRETVWSFAKAALEARRAAGEDRDVRTLWRGGPWTRGWRTRRASLQSWPVNRARRYQMKTEEQRRRAMAILAETGLLSELLDASKQGSEKAVQGESESNPSTESDDDSQSESTEFEGLSIEEEMLMEGFSPEDAKLIGELY